MKCLIVHNYYQLRGGEDDVFEAECALLESDGHIVERFTLHNDAVADHSRLKLISSTVWNRDIYRQLRQRVREFKPDIVHFHNTFPLISPAALHAAKDSGAAIVMTLHNFRLLCPSANLYRNERICLNCIDKTLKWPSVLHGCYRGSRSATAAVATMLAAHAVAGTFHGLVDKYIALSQHSRNLFIRAGFSQDDIVVKPNFLNEPRQGANRGLPREHFVLFVGRLVPEKGVLTLLEAWRNFMQPDIRLVIAGEGPLASQAGDAGGMVQWVGRKTKAEIYDLMARASLLVFPSEWYEPFGLVIIEAFANGLPVLAARIGSAEELVDPGRTGFLFEPGDPASLAAAVRTALGSPALLASLSVDARREYQIKYTPERNLNQLLTLYRDAIGIPPAQASPHQPVNRARA